MGHRPVYPYAGRPAFCRRPLGQDMAQDQREAKLLHQKPFGTVGNTRETTPRTSPQAFLPPAR